MRMQINDVRLWESLMAMAEIGATDGGGSSRLALTPEDAEGRALFIAWCQSLGMEIELDAIGNLFAIYPGQQRSLPPIVMGSHLDTQPKGGRFDGVYGVLAALEVVRTLHDNQIVLNHDLEIAVWMNEEGARFSPAMLGSEVFIEELALDKALSQKDARGISVAESLAQTKQIGARAFKREFDSYFELHIEQGPILEALDKEIGIVTGGQAIAWLDVAVKGRAQHAGTTPMRYRQDAMLGTSALLGKIEEYVANIEDALLTVGEIAIPYSSRNTIAGAVNFTLDVRHPETEKVKEMVRNIKHFGESVAADRSLSITMSDVWLSPAIPFDEACVDLVRIATKELGYSHHEMISGAGHDAIHLAKHCPTTMIFIACKDGISHNEAESITERDAANGTNVLLNAVLKRDLG